MYFLTTQSSKGVCSQAYECQRSCRRSINKETNGEKRVSHHGMYVVVVTNKNMEAKRVYDKKYGDSKWKPTDRTAILAYIGLVLLQTT